MSVVKYGLSLVLGATLVYAYPDSGTLKITGPSDLVGTYVVTNGGSNVSGYGGGYLGTVTDNVTNTSNTQLLFCNDFSNDVAIPAGPLAVYVSSLTDNSDISKTRFGAYAVNGYRAINTPLMPAQISSLSNATEIALNNATTLQRYQMAAYLVSQYSFLGDHPNSNVVHSDAASRGIQDAIWTLLDANGESYSAPSDTLQAGQTGSVTTYLTNAANWLQNGDRSFLSHYVVVTDASMRGLNSGIQELIMYTPVPEPRFGAVLAIALLAFGWMVRRRRAPLPALAESEAEK